MNKTFWFKCINEKNTARYDVIPIKTMISFGCLHTRIIIVVQLYYKL